MKKSKPTLLVLSLLIITGISIFVFLPSLHQDKVLAQQKNCLIIGQQAYKADILRYKIGKLQEPQYTYSKTLNTCLYAGGYTEHGGFSCDSPGAVATILNSKENSEWELWVKDSYSNQKLLSTSQGSFLDCEENLKNYQLQKSELFSL